MNGIIILGGEPYEGKIDVNNAYVIVCDGAYAYAKQCAIRFDECIGDFDTLGYVPDGATVYPSEKDYSDGELAMRRLIELRVDRITIYGGGGGRDDHWLSSLCLAEQAAENSIECIFITNYTTSFFIAHGRYYLNGLINKTVSFCALSEKLVFDGSVGLKYPLKNAVIKRGQTLGISNVCVCDSCYFSLSSGEGICFIIDKELNKV